MSSTDAILWSPPRLRQAPRHDALWNALASFAGATVPLAGRTGAAIALAEAPEPGAAGLRLRFGRGPGILAVPVAFPFKAVCGADLAVEDLAALPPALRDAVLEGMAGVATAALPESDRGAPSFAAGGPWEELAGAERDDLRWFRATLLGVAPQPVVTDLGATLPALEDLFGGTPAPRRVWGDLKARLHRDAYTTLGRLRSTAAAARDLRVGSVVVIAASFDPEVATLRVGERLFRFRPQGEGWACLGAEPIRHHTTVSGEHDMAEATGDPAEGGAAGAGAPELGIAIDLDIGRLTVTLAELETWQPGSIVALQPTPLQRGVEVTLRNEGRAIGTGDLVTIDDRLAVRLSSLARDG